jgi:hypothetical protein
VKTDRPDNQQQPDAFNPDKHKVLDIATQMEENSSSTYFRVHPNLTNAGERLLDGWTHYLAGDVFFHDAFQLIWAERFG